MYVGGGRRENPRMFIGVACHSRAGPLRLGCGVVLEVRPAQARARAAARAAAGATTPATTPGPARILFFLMRTTILAQF